MWEVNSQLSDAATAVDRGSVLENKGSGYPQFIPSTPRSVMLEPNPAMKSEGCVPGFATFGHRGVDAFFSCSENERERLSRIPAPKAGMCSSPSHPIESRAGDEPCQTPKGCEDL